MTVRRKHVRVSRDPVTGQLESIVLDDVRRHFERIVAAVDGAMLTLPTGDRDRLALMLVDRISQLLTSKVINETDALAVPRAP